MKKINKIMLTSVVFISACYLVWQLPTVRLYSLVFMSDKFPSFFTLNEEVTSGEMYGVSIGETKESTLKTIQLMQGKLWINLEMYKTGRSGQLTRLSFNEEQTALLLSSNKWIIYFSHSFSDKLEVHFREGGVVRIRRYYRKHELP